MRVWVPIELPKGYRVGRVEIEIGGMHTLTQRSKIVPLGPVLECIAPSIVERVDLRGLTNADLIDLAASVRVEQESRHLLLGETARQQPPRERWEYTYINWQGTLHDPRSEQDHLNRLGLDGWELISTGRRDQWMVSWLKRRLP